MSNIKLNNIPTMSVGRAVGALAELYSATITAHLPLHSLPSVMLWGPPGIGKSQAVRQLAEEIGRRTGKRTAVTDVRLLLFNPIDLRGIPTANADKTLAIWLKPQIFQMDPDPHIVNFLFRAGIIYMAAHKIVQNTQISAYSLVSFQCRPSFK